MTSIFDMVVPMFEAVRIPWTIQISRGLEYRSLSQSTLRDVIIILFSRIIDYEDRKAGTCEVGGYQVLLQILKHALRVNLI